ncbi:MAG: RNA polymerase sigma factor [Gaiellaceae bacterium]
MRPGGSTAAPVSRRSGWIGRALAPRHRPQPRWALRRARRVEATARRRLGLPVSTSVDEFAEADDRATTEGLAPALSRAVDALPPGQRDALQLRVVQELPYDEVASSLRITDVAARLRVMRALNALSRALKGATR